MKKLTNIAGFKTTTDFVFDKIHRYENSEKTFSVLYDFVFENKDNVLAEWSNGYKINKITYGECDNEIHLLANSFESALSFLQKGSIVGIYMGNSVDWIKTFWCVLMCGYNPLLLNAKLPKSVLENIFVCHGVKAVISDGETFNGVNMLNAFELLKQKGEYYQPKTWGSEIYFMTSGTTGNAKLCAYNPENIFYQICDSGNTIKICPPIQKHYRGELKLLMLLPFYHIFGFVAIFMWFTFMGRTLVFLKDLRPQTLLSTVKRHKVTHVFAVPLVWNSIYKEAMNKIKARGEKTYRKALKGLKIANGLGKFGDLFSKMAFKEVRENIFGDSISFCISGGGAIKTEVLEFFNGIGYHLSNGYGMTEIGVSGVETCMSKKERNLGSIGAPFAHAEYKINDKGELTVKTKAMAFKILVGDKTLTTDYDEFFNTKDLAKIENGKYFLCGRVDDLIIAETGENINPDLVECKLLSSLASDVCLIQDGQGTPTLIVSVEKAISKSDFKKLCQETTALIEQNNLSAQIKKVLYVSDSLMEDGDFKVSRKKIAKKYNEKAFKFLDLSTTEEVSTEKLNEREEKIIAIFAKVLDIPKEKIKKTQNFFTDLGGSSLEYFALIDEISLEFNKTITQKEGEPLLTTEDFCKYLNEN